jgi:hypothetical protein
MGPYDSETNSVQYWVRVLFTYCDVTQAWCKYLRGINNGFYTLLSYSSSQRHTYFTLGNLKRDIGADYVLTTGSCTKIQKKKYFFLKQNSFSFFFPSQPFPTVKNTDSRLGKRFLLKGISYTSQKPFLTDGSGYKRGCPIRCYSRAHSLFPKPSPHCCRQCYPSVSFLAFTTKSLG